jgi:hypothetical protein
MTEQLLQNETVSDDTFSIFLRIGNLSPNLVKDEPILRHDPWLSWKNMELSRCEFVTNTVALVR